MKYEIVNATGDAGEHFFAYKVATELGWPCRLLDIDIGIDAQIEILDDSKNSTGQFLAVQIKSTTSAEDCARYIDLKHVKYWQSVESPMLIALVNLKNKSVFVKHIQKTYKFKPTKRGSRTTKFEFNKLDLLSKKMIPRFRELAFEAEKLEVTVLLASLNIELKQIIFETELGKEPVIVDYFHYIQTMRDFRSRESRLYKCLVLVRRIYNSVGDCGYQKTYGLLITARQSLIDFMYKWNFHHNEEAVEINTFRDDCFRVSCDLQLSE
jgi:hypothetical protein